MLSASHKFSLLKISLILFFISASVSKAETIKWFPQNDALEIGNKAEVLQDAGGRFSFSQVSSVDFQKRFVPSKTTNLILGYTESVFWIKFIFENNSAENLVLEIAQAGLPDCDFYSRVNDDSTIIYKAGSNTPFHEKIIKSTFQVFPLLKGTHDYYIRLTTNSGPIPLRIYRQNTYDERSISQKFVYGIYLGLMLFVLLSNLFFFFSLQNYLYLVNALNVIIFVGYSMLVVDGFAPYFFPKIDMLFWYTTVPPFGVTIQTIYALWFLEVKKYRPQLYRFTLGVVSCYAIWFVMKFFLRFPIVQPINTLQALLSFFIMGYISIRVGKKGNKFGYYFALTYFVYFLLVLAEATYINTGKPSYILGFSYSGYATVLEALALSFLLTKRFEWEKKEIEEAKVNTQKKLFNQIVENEKMVRQQNIVLEKKVQERTHQLNEEKEKSDTLLLNILPEHTAQELKEKGSSDARQFEQVTVMFTDFKGFTQISEKLSPKELVNEIHDCFKAFDNIVTKHNIEKIKTIGDSYMCAGGLPLTNNTHAEDIVRAAIEIRDFISKKFESRNPKFEIRIGIHTGTVVAGIVGIKKFAYDIWGDTVNIASRMESSGEAGKVNISGSTYQLVKDKFNCIHRGKIQAKNKGEIDMYFVEQENS